MLAEWTTTTPFKRDFWPLSLGRYAVWACSLPSRPLRQRIVGLLSGRFDHLTRTLTPERSQLRPVSRSRAWGSHALPCGSGECSSSFPRPGLGQLPHVARNPRRRPPRPPSEPRAGDWPHGWQYYASRTLTEHSRECVGMPSLPPSSRALLRSQAGPHARTWLTAILCESTTTLPPL